MSHMRVLGIDPGYDRCGTAIVEKESGARERVLFSSCITTDKKEEFPKRLFAVAQEIKKIINEWRPDAVAMETLLVSKNQKTAMRVAETRGAITLVTEEAGLQLYAYAPPEIKLSVGGHGRSDKKDVERMVRLLVSFPKKDALDDEIDAVAVALSCFAREKIRYPHI